MEHLESLGEKLPGRLKVAEGEQPLGRADERDGAKPCVAFSFGCVGSLAHEARGAFGVLFCEGDSREDV